MKKVIRFIIGAAMLSAAAYPQTTTIGDLPDASSVAATDDFACDQGATTRACTALQIANYILTLVDTEAELETVLTDVSNLLTNNDEDFLTAAMLANGDWGDVVINSNNVTIDNDVVEESSLNVANLPTDEYALTWEEGTSNFEWSDALTANDTSITFTGAIDLITSSNGDIDLSPNGTGEINANAPLNTAASASPTIAWQDSDATAGDDNVTASVNCTDVGDGTEDCDITLQQQIAGTPTDVMVANADGTGNARIVLPDSSIGPDEIMATGQTDGYFLQYESTGDTVQWAVGSGGAFDDSSDPVVMNTITKDVHFGDGAGTLTGKVEIGGDADQPQLVVEGHSTQTDSIVIVQNDADTEVFTIDADGTTTIAGSTSTITGSGTYVEIDDVLLITAAATPPIACSGSGQTGIMYHDTSGVICICNGASPAWVEVVDYTTTGTCE